MFGVSRTTVMSYQEEHMNNHMIVKKKDIQSSVLADFHVEHRNIRVADSAQSLLMHLVFFLYKYH